MEVTFPEIVGPFKLLIFAPNVWQHIVHPKTQPFLGGKTCTRRSIKQPRLLVARTSCSGMLALWAKTLAWSMWFAPKGGVKITVRYVKHGVLYICFTWA